METLMLEPFMFKSPTIIQICGPTLSGKSYFLLKILKYKHQLFQEDPVQIIYNYGVTDDNFLAKIKKIVPNIILFEGVPTKDDIRKWKISAKSEHFLIILDDLLSKIKSNDTVEDLYTKICHHWHASLITCSQNVFSQGKSSRTCSINSHVFCFTPNQRDVVQIKVFGSQVFPGRGRDFLDIYNDAMSGDITEPDCPPHLVVNCHPYANKKLRLMANIFPPDGARIVYYL